MPRRPSPEEKITLKEVAETAGVAVSTASLVFSGKRRVAEETRAKVLAAAEQLGYGGPDPLASSLRQGRSSIVGIYAEGRLLNSFSDPFAVSVLDGLAQHLGAQSRGILLIPAAGNPGEDVRHMATFPLDAVVFPLGGHVSEPVLEHLRSRRIPLIAANYPRSEGVTVLETDERAAMKEIATYLYEQGHRDVALVEMPHTVAGRHESNPEAIDRTAGFLEVFPQAHVVQAPENSIEGGLAATNQVLAEVPAVTAIANHSDLLAVGSLRALGTHGLSTPADVSVTGFDGIDLPWLIGSLTTINQFGQAKGRALAELVQRAIDTDDETLRSHPYELVRGSSTDVPRISDSK